MTAKLTAYTSRNIKSYIVGNIRYWLYTHKLGFLISLHVRQQYRYRLTKMNPECYYNGNCIKCGCLTPNLQFANKACEGKCYMPMLNRHDWYNYFKLIPHEDLEELKRYVNAKIDVE